MTSNNQKKEVIQDWNKEFTELSIHSQNKLYRIVGSFIFGIEIITIPGTESYRPIFACYPLWKTNATQCLEEPIFLQEIINKAGLQFDISMKEHKQYYKEAIEYTKDQAPILVLKEVDLNILFNVINEQFNQTLIKSSPVGQAKLFSAKFYAALFANDTNSAEKVLKEIFETSQKWNHNLFEWKFGKLDEWLQNMQSSLFERSELIKRVNENKKEKKLVKLKFSDLISV